MDVELKSRVERAKSGIRIDQVVTGLGLELTKRGRSLFIRCPSGAHEDKDPSCVVNVEKGFVKCFGCGWIQDGIGVVRKVTGKSFGESLAYVEDLGGGGPAPSSSAIPTRGEIEETFADPVTPDLLERVSLLWEKTLYRTSPGRRYLESRGLADPELLKVFRIGYCDGRLPGIASPAEKALLAKIGVLNSRGNSVFYRAITIPILGEHGKPVGFYGRRTTATARGHLGLIGPHRGVFNRDAWFRCDEVVLAEGPIDALSLHAAGVTNATSLFGTNGWTPHHESALRDGRVKSIVLALDNDEAGRKASVALAASLSAKGVSVRMVKWPDGVKDANDLVRLEGGRDKLAGIVADAVEIARPATPPHPVAAVEVAAPAATLDAPVAASPAAPPAPVSGNGTQPKVEIADRQAIFSFDGVTYRVFGLDAVQPPQSIRVRIDATKGSELHKDRVELVSGKSRTTFARAAGRILSVHPEAVEKDLKQIGALIESHATQKAKEREGTARVRPLTPKERDEALSFLKDPRLLERVCEDIERLGYVGENVAKTLLYVIATSRKLARPMAALVKGPSSAGKSQAMALVAELMPKEDVFLFSRISPQALYYMERGALKHKLLVIDERDGSADADYSIRTLLTQRRLSLAVVMKDPDGKSRTYLFEVEGPIAYFESTTQDELNPENENRCWVAYIDASKEQTAKVVAAQKAGYTKGGSLPPAKREAILERHRNVQRLLEPAEIEIPFLDPIRFPVDQVRARRDHARFLSLIGAVAFVHQHQRERWTDDSGRRWVVATKEDYRIAYELARDALAGGLDELPPPIAASLALVEDKVNRRAEKDRVKPESVLFTRSDVMDWIELPLTSARRLLARLVEHEIVDAVPGPRGSAFRYRLTGRRPSTGGLDGVTRPEELT